MADTGWRTAGTGTNRTDWGGKVAWTTPGNINNTGSSYAYFSRSSSGASRQLYASNFGFGGVLPDNVIITGVSVRRRIEAGYAWGGGPPARWSLATTFSALQLADGSSRQGSTKSGAFTTPRGDPQIDDIGESSPDTWGWALTRDDVIATDFGVAMGANRNAVNSGVTATAYVFYVQMKIYYEEAPSNTGSFFALFADNVKDRIKDILKPKPKFWLPEKGVILT